jgi:hypothetical protein
MTSELPPSSLRLKLQRTDGKVGTYVQHDPRLVRALLVRLRPEKLFGRDLITIGIANPFTVLNASEVCWIEVETGEPMAAQIAPVDYQCTRLPSRQAFEESLGARWMTWIHHSKPDGSGLFEALIELNFRGGASLFLSLSSSENNASPEVIFSAAAIVARGEAGQIVLINPKALLRCRVYHNHGHPELPEGLWFAEAEDI